MTRRDGVELLALGALWGASFLFMRLGAADFGPVALVFVRVAGATLMLLPLLALRGEGTALMQHWRAIAMVGIVNSVLPFLLYTVAALVLSAALMSVVNATVPIWGALVARLWLGDRLGPTRALGLAIAWPAWWHWPGARPTSSPVSTASAGAGAGSQHCGHGLVRAGRQHLAPIPGGRAADGRGRRQPAQRGAGAAAAGLADVAATPPGAVPWAAALALALACTGLAYVLYFRLIAHAGAAQAVTVTFLIPPFAMLWGWLFLDEQPTLGTLAACAVILLGTGLSTGVLQGRARPGSAPSAR